MLNNILEKLLIPQMKFNFTNLKITEYENKVFINNATTNAHARNGPYH